MLHEQIHVFQVKHRYHTDPLEVCYLGTDKTGYGWVTFEVPANESNLNASRDEMEALSVQIIYGLAVSLLLMKFFLDKEFKSHAQYFL